MQWKILCFSALVFSSVGIGLSYGAGEYGFCDKTGSKYYSGDPENEGCSQCDIGAYYRREMRPFKIDQKALYNCFQCPERSEECYFDELLMKIYIFKCKNKSYRLNPPNSDGICYACPPNALKCELMDDKIVPTVCDAKYYIKQTGDNAWDLSCLHCPDHALSCAFNKSLGKVVIPEDKCEPKYFVERVEQGD